MRFPFVVASALFSCVLPIAALSQTAPTPAPTAVPAAKPLSAPSPSISAPAPSESPSAQVVSPAAFPTPVIVPLTDAELRAPDAALAASRKTIGGAAWNAFGALYMSGIAQVQNQSPPFTYSANLRSGYNRMIVLLPRNAGTYEYGVDRGGGWSASGGVVRHLSATAQSIKTALYVNRFGFFNFPGDAAVVKEIGVDPNLGDRISITPAGGTSVLALIKPATTLMSAVQFANGQVGVYADYRPISGVLFPYRTMQGSSVNALSVFQATTVELLAKEPDAAAVTRPKLVAADTRKPAAMAKPTEAKPKAK